jgi:hypothetical protein
LHAPAGKKPIGGDEQGIDGLAHQQQGMENECNFSPKVMRPSNFRRRVRSSAAWAGSTCERSAGRDWLEAFAKRPTGRRRTRPTGRMVAPGCQPAVPQRLGHGLVD